MWMLQLTQSECNVTCVSWKALVQLSVLICKLFDFGTLYGTVEHANAIDGECPHFVFANVHRHGFCYNSVVMMFIIHTYIEGMKGGRVGAWQPVPLCTCNYSCTLVLTRW